MKISADSKKAKALENQIAYADLQREYYEDRADKLRSEYIKLVGGVPKSAR